MTGSRATNRLARFTAFLLIAALTACGSEVPSKPVVAAGLQALRLQGPQGGQTLTVESTFKVFTVGSQDPGWPARCEVRDLSAVPAAPGQTQAEDAPIGLHIGSRAGMRIDLPGPFASQSFNLVELAVSARAGLDFFVALRRNKKIVSRSRTVHLQPAGDIMRVQLELPPSESGAEPYDELSIVIGAGSYEFWLFEALLIDRPAALWLGIPDGIERGILVGDDLRPARCLLPDQALVGTSDQPLPAHSLLSFDVGLPPIVRKPAGTSELAITLSAQGVPDVHWKMSLVTEASADPRWHSFDIDLQSFAGRRVHIRMQLTGDGAHAAAIANVALRQVDELAPSILLITSDTHRADHLGFTGGAVSTPNIDALARSGVSFLRCSSTTNTTNPAHIALMTGVHPRDTRVIDNHTPLADAAPTLAEAFRAAGWDTWGVSSTPHLAAQRSGLGQGFARYSAPLEGQRDSSASLAILDEWLAASSGRRTPLFIWLHIFDAHAPYDPPAEDLSPYWSSDKDAYHPSLPAPEAWQVPHWKAGTRDLNYLVALYRGEVSYLDRQLGALFEHEHLKQGLIVLTADHGESLLAHGVFFDHRELYPDTLDVPLVMRGPGLTAGKTIDRPVSLIDLGRTLLDAAQIPAQDFPGQNLFAEESRAQPQFALSADGLSASIRLWPWFLVLDLQEHRPNKGAALKPLHGTELYLLSSDPACLADLAHVEPARAKPLRRLLINWLGEARELGWKVERKVFDREALDQLAAMGYSTNVDSTGDETWIATDCECEQCLRFAR